MSEAKPNTTKIKTENLSGPQLHYAVAVADGRLNPKIKDGECLIMHGGKNGPIVSFDAAWFKVQILPKNKMSFSKAGFGGFYAACSGQVKKFHGESQLIAAMRAFVATKLGDEVEVPDDEKTRSGLWEFEGAGS